MWDQGSAVLVSGPPHKDAEVIERFLILPERGSHQFYDTVADPTPSPPDLDAGEWDAVLEALQAGPGLLAADRAGDAGWHLPEGSPAPTVHDGVSSTPRWLRVSEQVLKLVLEKCGPVRSTLRI